MNQKMEVKSDENREKSNAINSSPDTLIEAKLSKISKAFSIENLIAKKSTDKMEVENECLSLPDLNYQQQHQHRIPPIAFPQNFPLYNPWAANYLMSHTNVSPQNLLLNASACVVNSQQLYQLQNDKLGNFSDTQQPQLQSKEKFTEMLFNPLNSLPQDQNNLSTYQQLLHHHPDQANFFASKLKDANFLNEFYTNYFMLENNRIMNLTINTNSDNNNVVMKRTKKNFPNENCGSSNNNNNNNISVNDNSNNSDYDNNVSESHKMMIMERNGIYYEEDSSYSDLSVTMSPEQIQSNQQDKGERSWQNLIKFIIFERNKKNYLKNSNKMKTII